MHCGAPFGYRAGGGPATKRPAHASNRPPVPRLFEGLVLSPRHSISLRRQLAAQIGAAIRSGELPSGARCPSVRRLAVRLGLHRNTVLAAYAELEREGLVRRRRRKGVYVRPLDATGDRLPGEAGTADLETEFADFLRAQRSRGRSVGELNRLLGRWEERSSAQGIVVLEPEPALRRLIVAEIAAGLPGVEVSGSTWCRARRSLDALRGRCLVARPELAARGFDPAVADLLPLRTASAVASRRALRALRHGEVAALLTPSRILRRHARELLAGDLGGTVGFTSRNPGNRKEVERVLRISSLIFTDSLTTLPQSPPLSGCRVQQVRVVDPAWTRGLGRYLGVLVGPSSSRSGEELERM